MAAENSRVARMYSSAPMLSGPGIRPVTRAVKASAADRPPALGVRAKARTSQGQHGSSAALGNDGNQPGTTATAPSSPAQPDPARQKTDPGDPGVTQEIPMTSANACRCATSAVPDRRRERPEHLRGQARHAGARLRHGRRPGRHRLRPRTPRRPSGVHPGGVASVPWFPAAASAEPSSPDDRPGDPPIWARHHSRPKPLTSGNADRRATSVVGGP
jgi:hypothetical protein